MYELHLLCPNDRLNSTQTKSSKTLGSGCLHTLFLMFFVELHTTYSSGHLMYTSGSELFAWDLVCNHYLPLANFFSQAHTYIIP